MSKKTSLTFSEDELRFLDWAMRFLEGGPIDFEKEEKREKLMFRLRQALIDYEAGISRAPNGSSFSIECAFCGGGGVFPDIRNINGIETDPCPVCEGKGLNSVNTSPDNILKCRFCGGGGKAWDSSGYATGDVCLVCNGMGIVIFNQQSHETEFFWNLIHPTIIKVSKSRFESGHYADAVEAAIKEINKIIKSIVRAETGEELDGAQLMTRAFSPKKPIICLGDLSTQSGQNEQLGYMQIFSGVMTGIRNPKAHENIVIDVSRAIHLLILASLLMYKIDDYP